MTVSYVLRFEERPWTTNAERQMHKYERAAKVAEWRRAFFSLAKEQQIPLIGNVHVKVTPYHKDRRWVADVGNVFPSFKAALDGIVDAGCLVDDNPDHFIHLEFMAPIIGFGDGLELEIIGDELDPSLLPPKPVVKKKKPPYNNGRRKSATRSRQYVRKKPRIP